jgi:hypothetical protein
MGRDSLRPSSLSMDEHCSRGVLHITNSFFCSPVLKMSVDSTKGNRLTLFSRILHEGVVGVVVLNFDVLRAAISFECALSFDLVVRQSSLLEVDISDPRSLW